MNLPGSFYIGYGWGGRYRTTNQGGAPAMNIESQHTWDDDYPGGVSDGSWVNYEMYVKMESQPSATDGVLRMWSKGVLIREKTDVNWAQSYEVDGWYWFDFLSNQKDPGLERAYYVDLDDMVVYNQTPPNVDEHGNPFIGPIGWGVVSELLGDLNSDGTVNIFDYNIFLQNFGATDCGNVADLNGDSVVDIFDYNILLENFGMSNE